MITNPRKMHISQFAIRFGRDPMKIGKFFGPAVRIKDAYIAPKSVFSVLAQKSWKPPLDKKGNIRGMPINAGGKSGDVLVILANYEIPQIFNTGHGWQLEAESRKGVDLLLRDYIPSAVIHNLIQTKYVGIKEKEKATGLIRNGDYHALEKTIGKKKEKCVFAVPVHVRFSEKEAKRYRKIKRDSEIRAEFVERIREYGLTQKEIEKVLDREPEFILNDFYCLSIDGKRPLIDRKDGKLALFIPKGACESANWDVDELLRHFPGKRRELKPDMHKLSVIYYTSMYCLEIYTNLIVWEEFLYKHYLVHENEKTRRKFTGYMPKRGKRKAEKGFIFDEVDWDDVIPL